MQVSSVKKNQEPYFAEGAEQKPREKQAPEFTIKPRNIQVWTTISFFFSWTKKKVTWRFDKLGKF